MSNNQDCVRHESLATSAMTSDTMIQQHCASHQHFQRVFPGVVPISCFISTVVPNSVTNGLHCICIWLNSQLKPNVNSWVCSSHRVHPIRDDLAYEINWQFPEMTGVNLLMQPIMWTYILHTVAPTDGKNVYFCSTYLDLLVFTFGQTVGTTSHIWEH